VPQSPHRSLRRHLAVGAFSPLWEKVAEGRMRGASVTAECDAAQTYPRPPNTKYPALLPAAGGRRDERLRGEIGRVGRRAHRSCPLQSTGSYPAQRRSLRSRGADHRLCMGQSPASSSWAGRADGLTDSGARRGHGLAYRRLPTARTRAPPRRLHWRQRQTARLRPARRLGMLAPIPAAPSSRESVGRGDRAAARWVGSHKLDVTSNLE
jgi:hypothetical protein